MNFIIKAKRLGDNWYLDLDHLDPNDIRLNRRESKVLSMIDKYNRGELYIALNEEYSIVNPDTIFLEDSDLLRYFTTSDSFNMRFYINDHEFSISTETYSLIELEFNPNFHKTLYKIEIFD